MPSAVLQEDFVPQDLGEDSQPPDISISEEMRSALMKKVVLEKRRTNSYKKVDLKRVSDPKGMGVYFICHRMYQAQSCGLL